MKPLTVIILLAMVACTHKLKPVKNDSPWGLTNLHADTILYTGTATYPLHLATFNDKPDSSWMDTVHGFIRYPKFGNKIPALISVNNNRQELHYMTDPSMPMDVYKRATAIYSVTHLMYAFTMGPNGVTDTLRILKKIFVYDDGKHGEGMYSNGQIIFFDGPQEFDLSKHYEFITPDKIVRE